MAVETQPGIWSDEITEKKYYGSIIKDNRKMDNTGVINSGISINNNISIISNKFMLDNMAHMIYITLFNSKWVINSIEVISPRIIITIGGAYNE